MFLLRPCDITELWQIDFRRTHEEPLKPQIEKQKRTRNHQTMDTWLPLVSLSDHPNALKTGTRDRPDPCLVGGPRAGGPQLLHFGPRQDAASELLAWHAIVHPTGDHLWAHFK